MSEINFKYKVTKYIDTFGNKKLDGVNLYDSYVQIDEALAAFYEAQNSEEQYLAHEQLLATKQPLIKILNDMK